MSQSNGKGLHGKVAVITGASRGLGKAMALSLAGAGVHLALVARDVEKLNETATAARELGTEAGVYEADVTREGDVLAMEKQVIERFG